ncbi:hypothetical protein [Streptomyces gardneri]|uniref:hypothetical protein n=1 Tax=Streptomyces gardneri TaxID=66892 RepID=UPI0035DACA4E
MGAVRITTADGQAVTVTSTTDTVPNWATRYLGSWWSAEPTTLIDGPTVSADLDEAELMALANVVEQGNADTVEYAGAALRVARDGQLVTAVQENRSLAYRWDEEWKLLRIVGTDETEIATAAARLARELLRAQLLDEDWAILHASAVTSADGDGATILTLGDKGAGKTTTALTLARAGRQLLANDRVFARVDEHGVVQVLPWPSAAAFGFGLLDALDLFETVRTRLASGEQMHPTQHQKVTDALLAGRREPLWKANGKELKPQLWPDQLTSWLSMPLATKGHAVGILYPQITACAAPRLTESSRGVQPGDFFDETTEDRYPDIFGLLPTPGDRTFLREHLDALSHQGLVMNHDPAANATILKEAVARLAG